MRAVIVILNCFLVVGAVVLSVGPLAAFEIRTLTAMMFAGFGLVSALNGYRVSRLEGLADSYLKAGAAPQHKTYGAGTGHY